MKKMRGIHDDARHPSFDLPHVSMHRAPAHDPPDRRTGHRPRVRTSAAPRKPGPSDRTRPGRGCEPVEPPETANGLQAPEPATCTGAATAGACFCRSDSRLLWLPIPRFAAAKEAVRRKAAPRSGRQPGLLRRSQQPEAVRVAFTAILRQFRSERLHIMGFSLLFPCRRKPASTSRTINSEC